MLSMSLSSSPTTPWTPSQWIFWCRRKINESSSLVISPQSFRPDPASDLSTDTPFVSSVLYAAKRFYTPPARVSSILRVFLCGKSERYKPPVAREECMLSQTRQETFSHISGECSQSMAKKIELSVLRSLLAIAS